jgi:DNA-binding YbaB/EbfC family protein
MMKGNIAQMMQKAQRMQENMQKVQEELAQMEVTGQAGGGVVKITLTGKMEARKVAIDPSVLADAEMLEDLVVAALNDAVNKVNDESNKRMAAVTAGMPMPPGLKLPF